MCCLSANAFAQWEIDNNASSVNFVSIKNESVAETHRFTSLGGFISAEGAVQLAIDLDSVDTKIEIRNERVRELLFETKKFPAAQVTAQIDPQLMASVLAGSVATSTVNVTLSLHGIEKTIPLSLVAVADENNRLRVYTAQPALINAADFGLVRGVTALQEIAGLKGISQAVPVTLNLVFTLVTPAAPGVDDPASVRDDSLVDSAPALGEPETESR